MAGSPFEQDYTPSPSAMPGQDTMRRMKVAVVGGGNGAKTMAAMAGQWVSKVDLYYSPKYAERAAALTEAIQRNGGLIVHTKVDENGKPNTAIKSPVNVTTDPACVAAADVVIVSLPGPAREQAVMEIGPHLKNQLVVFLPGSSGGVDLCLLRSALGSRAESCFAQGLIYAASKSLPWSTRERAPGEMHVRGTKARMDTVVFPSTAANRFTATGLMSILHSHPAAPTTFVTSEHWLEATHIPYNYCGNPLMHTSVMYGFWRDWDGTPFDEVPLFYHGMTDLAGQTLESFWGELKATNEGLAKALGLEEPPSSLRRVHSVVLERYSAVVGDPSTMLTSLRTNGAYAYTIHPMQKDPASGKLIPNFKARYLMEDIPYGLCAIRGVAEICKVPTPTIDKVILWAQEKIGKSYLVDGRLVGPDIADSGAPQRWGINRPADLLAYVPADVVVTNMEALASAVSNSLGAASEALLQQLGSLALPSLVEEEEGQEEGAGAANGNGATAAAPKLAAQRSRGALLARRLSQRLLSQGSQGLCVPSS